MSIYLRHQSMLGWVYSSQDQILTSKLFKFPLETLVQLVDGKLCSREENPEGQYLATRKSVTQNYFETGIPTSNFPQ